MPSPRHQDVTGCPQRSSHAQISAKMRTVEINDRAILVIDPEPDTAVSLRDRISTRRAIVRRTEASGAEDKTRTLKPHPFAVVGVTRGSEPPVLSPAVLEVLASEPIPVVWRGTPPKGL